MDGGALEMDLGMEFYEQWDWQRFRDAESMELEDEEVESAMQISAGVENGEEDVKKDERAREDEERNLHQRAIPQYDGADDDADMVEETGSISKTGGIDVDGASRQIILSQHDDSTREVEEATLMSKTRVEEATLMSKTRVEEIDLSPHRDDTISTPLSDEAMKQIDSEGQEQSTTLEASETRQEENLETRLNQNYEALQAFAEEGEHLPEDLLSDRKLMLAEEKTLQALIDKDGDNSEGQNEQAEHGGNRETATAADESISDFWRSETVDGVAIPKEPRNQILASNLIVTETTSKLDPPADVEILGGNSSTEEQINNEAEEPIINGQCTESKEGQDKTSSLRESATEGEVEASVDEAANGVHGGLDKIQVNISALARTHSDIVDDAEIHGNTNSHFELDNHAGESTTSGFLSKKDLRDLEGEPISLSTQDLSPVKSTTRIEYPEVHMNAAKDTTIQENTQNTADVDNVPGLTYAQAQDSSITDQGPANDNGIGDINLPPLLRTEAPIQTKQTEVPDSDTITESSQQSPQKPSHIESVLERVVEDTKNEGKSMETGLTREEKEDAETEDAVISFGKECATSSIDPKKHLSEPETMEADGPWNGSDNSKKPAASLEVVLVGSRKKLVEDSRSDVEDYMEVESPSLPLPQKKTNKRAPPPGRKMSGMSNNKGDDKELTEKMVKPVEVDLDKSMTMDGKDNSNANSPVPEKRKRGRPAGRKTSALSLDGSPTEQGKTNVDATENDDVSFTDKSAEVIQRSSTKETLPNELSQSSPVPGKRKRGRPAGRRISTMSTAMGKEDDDENPEKAVTAVNEEKTHPQVISKSKSELGASSPGHSMQEGKTKGRSSSRKVSALSAGKKDIEDSGEGLDALNESIDDTLEPVINDTMDEMTTNSSSPVKRRRGRMSRTSSELSPKKRDTMEGTKETSSNFAVLMTGIVEMEEVTPNHKAIEENVAVSSSSVKRKRGRPAGRKSSGIEAEQTGVDDLHNEVSSLPLDESEHLETTTTGHQGEGTADNSPVRPRKRGRPSSRKVSELKCQEAVVEGETYQVPDDIATEEAVDSAIIESLDDVQVPKGSMDIEILPMKKKRGRPSGRKISELSPEKASINNATEVISDPAMENAADSGISASVDDLQSVNNPPCIVLSSPEKRKEGRPSSRRVSKVNSREGAEIEDPVEILEDIVTQEVAVADIDELSMVDAPPKRKRGRPANRKSSGISPENEVTVETFKETSNNAPTTASDEAESVDIRNHQISLSINPSPEKRKRGRPARNASGLNTGSAAKERISSDVDFPGKSVPVEIVDSEDEEEDESPPAKKVKPEPRKRGRPSAIKSLSINLEDKNSDKEGLTEKESTMAENDDQMEVDQRAQREPPPSERRKRGRPSAASKARRISNSDSEVTEEEQQVSEKFKLSRVGKKEYVDAESEEQEEPVAEKKKRGRPALLKNKRNQTSKSSEPADGEDTIARSSIPTTSSSKSKVSGRQISTTSNTSSFSQRQDPFYAEMKAMKISSLQSRNSQLRIEIEAKKTKTREITQDLAQPAQETVKRHIKLLHDYNDIKDVGQGLVGMIADNRGVRVGELYEEFGVSTTD